MKQILLNIPDNKYQALLDAIKGLDFIRVHNANDVEISDEEKKLIRGRIKNSNPALGENWDDIKDSFILD